MNIVLAGKWWAYQQRLGWKLCEGGCGRMFKPEDKNRTICIADTLRLTGTKILTAAKETV